jgi:hypothetical protein
MRSLRTEKVEWMSESGAEGGTERFLEIPSFLLE